VVLLFFSGTIFGLFGELFNKGNLVNFLNYIKNLNQILADRFYLKYKDIGDQNELGFEKFNLNKS
jgi:DNA polymerase-3 subunit alpha